MSKILPVLGIFVLLALFACGGGGGGDVAFSFLGTYRGTLFLTNNTCSFSASDTMEVRYVINSDSAQTIVAESNSITNPTFIGPPLDGTNVLKVTQQQQENCTVRGTFVVLRTITFTRDSKNELTVNRSQNFAGCDQSDCERSWTGTVLRDE